MSRFSCSWLGLVGRVFLSCGDPFGGCWGGCRCGVACSWMLRRFRFTISKEMIENACDLSMLFGAYAGRSFVSFLSPPKMHGFCLTLFHQELLSRGHPDAPLHVLKCLDDISCPGGRPATCFGGRVGPACGGCPPRTYWSALGSKAVTCFILFPCFLNVKSSLVVLDMCLFPFGPV